MQLFTIMNQWESWALDNDTHSVFIPPRLLRDIVMVAATTENPASQTYFLFWTIIYNLCVDQYKCIVDQYRLQISGCWSWFLTIHSAKWLIVCLTSLGFEK